MNIGTELPKLGLFSCKSGIRRQKGTKNICASLTLLKMDHDAKKAKEREKSCKRANSKIEIESQVDFLGKLPISLSLKMRLKLRQRN